MATIKRLFACETWHRFKDMVSLDDYKKLNKESVANLIKAKAFANAIWHFFAYLLILTFGTIVFFLIVYLICGNVLRFFGIEIEADNSRIIIATILALIYITGLIIILVLSIEKYQRSLCQYLEKKQSRSEVSGESEIISLFMYVISTERPPANSYEYAKRVLKSINPNATLGKYTFVGIKHGDVSIQEGLQNYYEMVGLGRGPNYGEPFNEISCNGPDGKKVVALLFR